MLCRAGPPSVFSVDGGDGAKIAHCSFSGGSDGTTPLAGVISDAEGNLYGTTDAGGGTGCQGYGCGTVFEIENQSSLPACRKSPHLG